ncbi:MAG TPA: cytochrome c biogenesis protein ResB [candidate division Zixibacteria bacterium]|nr:cytochrome c biogenesis protein ResB [candidate division Zixibacteria bacterium]
MDFNIAAALNTFFKSRKLAVSLLVLIIVFSIIGTHIPQKSQLKSEVYNAWKTNHPVEAEFYEMIGFTNLFSSFIFLFLALLLFINTLFCTRSMLNNAFRRLSSASQFQKKAYITGLENNAKIITGKERETVFSQIKDILNDSGYNVSSKDNYILGHKNKHGTMGIPLLHVCIILIMLAAVYGSTGRMEGDMRLIEGQTLSEDHGNYMFINEGPFFNEKHEKFDITLEKFYSNYMDETGTPRGAGGRLVIMENGHIEKTGVTYSNNMITYEGYSLLGNVYGLAPLLILRNPDGTVYSGSYITASDLDESGRYVASFDIGDTGLEGGLMVYMTANLTSEKIMESEVDQTPILFVKIFDNGKEIYDGTLKLNDTVKVSDKFLGFYDIKYWSNFYIVKDNGTFLLYFAIGLITLSLFISFFIVPKRVWAEVVHDEKNDMIEVFIGGRADKFRSLYEDEFNSIMNKIKERL